MPLFQQGRITSIYNLFVNVSERVYQNFGTPSLVAITLVSMKGE